MIFKMLTLTWAELELGAKSEKMFNIQKPNITLFVANVLALRYPDGLLRFVPDLSLTEANIDTTVNLQLTEFKL